MEQIVITVEGLATQGSQIQTAFLVILGVVVTIAIAWTIVRGMGK